jgi:REP element-mobilizing transposase RayT
MDEQQTVHLMMYQIIWCPKRRRKVLLGQLAERLEQIVHEVATAHDWEGIRLGIQPEHVHLFIRAHPYTLPTDIARTIISACACGWTNVVFPRTIYRSIVRYSLRNILLRLNSILRPVKPQQIVPGSRSRASMTTASSTSQARKAIPNSNMIIEAWNTSKPDGS